MQRVDHIDTTELHVVFSTTKMQLNAFLCGLLLLLKLNGKALNVNNLRSFACDVHSTTHAPISKETC